MSIIDFIAVVSFGLTCFSLGYNFGKDTEITKIAAQSCKLWRLFLHKPIWTNRLSMYSFQYHNIMHFRICQIFFHISRNLRYLSSTSFFPSSSPLLFQESPILPLNSSHTTGIVSTVNSPALPQSLLRFQLFPIPRRQLHHLGGLGAFAVFP